MSAGRGKVEGGGGYFYSYVQVERVRSCRGKGGCNEMQYTIDNGSMLSPPPTDRRTVMTENITFVIPLIGSKNDDNVIGNTIAP